jgi:hypothetical protein
MTNAGGSELELTKKACHLHAETDLTIEAPGKTVTIRASAIRLVKG